MLTLSKLLFTLQNKCAVKIQKASRLLNLNCKFHYLTFSAILVAIRSNKMRFFLKGIICSLSTPWPYQGNGFTIIISIKLLIGL